jgi:hypothetical protein
MIKRDPLTLNRVRGFVFYKKPDPEQYRSIINSEVNPFSLFERPFIRDTGRSSPIFKFTWLSRGCYSLSGYL